MHRRAPATTMVSVETRTRALIAGAAVAVVALATVACGGGEGRTLDLSGADNGAAIEVEAGTVLVLTIDSNRTTGYRWNLVGDPHTDVLVFRSSVYEEPDDAAGEFSLSVTVA